MVMSLTKRENTGKEVVAGSGAGNQELHFGRPREVCTSVRHSGERRCQLKADYAGWEFRREAGAGDGNL